VTPCILVDGHEHFGGNCYLNSQGTKSDHEDGGSRFLRNVASLSNYRAGNLSHHCDTVQCHLSVSDIAVYVPKSFSTRKNYLYIYFSRVFRACYLSMIEYL